MATSVFFNNFLASQEQNLIENLIIESIQIYGHDLYYLPRIRESFDPIYGESAVSSFKSSYFLDMYIKNVDGFDGEGDFISKFGLEIRDRVTFTVARRTFFNEVGAPAELNRPREGDLIFFPLNKKVFEIKFVEHEAIFYQLGALQTFDIICELFEYSNELFATGIPDIDETFTGRTGVDYTESMAAFAITTEDVFALLDEDGYRLVNETYEYQDPGENQEIQLESDAFIDFSERDPFSEGTY